MTQTVAAFIVNHYVPWSGLLNPLNTWKYTQYIYFFSQWGSTETSGVLPSSPPSRLVLPLCWSISLHDGWCCISHMQASLVMTRANMTCWKSNESVKEVKARHLLKRGPKVTPQSPVSWYRCCWASEEEEGGGPCSVRGRWNIPSSTKELLAGMC